MKFGMSMHNNYVTSLLIKRMLWKHLGFALELQKRENDFFSLNKLLKYNEDVVRGCTLVRIIQSKKVTLLP